MEAESNRETKSWYKSKVLWVNIIAIVLEISTHLLKVGKPIPHLEEIVFSLNIILRFVTDKPIGKENKEISYVEEEQDLF